MELCKENWNVDSWKSRKAIQLPEYPSNDELNNIIQKISQASGLIEAEDVEKFRESMALVAEEKGILLQIGDCAESFYDCTSNITTQKAKHLQTLGKIISEKFSCPVIHVGRIAGQYAKPRSLDSELYQGELIPCYRGDIINGASPSLHARIPQAKLMLIAYRCSAAIIKQLRLLNNSPDFKDSTIYTSHEGLLLFYEQALTKHIANKWYNLSTHFPWLGMRTAEKSFAHIEYFRGIANSIAIKIGPNITCDWLEQLILTLDPHKTPGKITLIHRLGKNDITTLLPKFIKTVQTLKRKIIWACDPMHGNTQVSQITGKKIRRIEDIIYELEQAIKIHKDMDSYLGGLHLEATYENVLECIDMNSIEEVENADSLYQSLLDPRLNLQQSISVVNAFASQ